MMELNILIDRLPKTVIIGRREYEINSDFRTSLLFDIMMKRRDLSDEEKIVYTLELYYPIIPDDTDKAINSVLWFFNRGIEKKSEKKNSLTKKKEFYSFKQDAPYIFADFLSEYKINLQRAEGEEVLHWWEFLALFESLSEDSKMSKIIYYRTVDLSGMTRKQKQAMNEMKKLYEIKDNNDVNDELKLAKRNADMKAYVRERIGNIEENKTS